MLDTTSLHASMRDLGLEPVVCRRVLIVDDEPALIETLEGLLEDHFDVITASGGRDALRQLEAGDIVDVIVTDQRMPGMLGVDFLEEASKRLPDTIRMVVTAYADVDPIIDAINRGAAYRFLSKPYNADELRAAITEGMQLKAARTSSATSWPPWRPAATTSRPRSTSSAQPKTSSSPQSASPPWAR